MRLSFAPTLDREETERRLARLLVEGSVRDAALTRRLHRIADRFRSYASCYPLPLWAPGLIISNEMRAVTESLFPMSEVRPLFDLVLRRGCRFAPLLSGTYLHTSPSWLDLLHRLRPHLRCADPAATLGEIVDDGAARRRFLFSLLLPHHFGGAFDRYPRQSQWIHSWLTENRRRLGGRIRALDSACGSGEGTYNLAELLEESGFVGNGSVLHGSTVEQVELFAAAHAFFPHDAEREARFRARVAPLLGKPDQLDLEFYLDDVASHRDGEPYDLILCNGLLGGPLMNEKGVLALAIRALASRLAPGGVLLAADRFHEGWRVRVPEGELLALLREQGLTALDVPEGIGGVKP